jgi:hypothetical protein
MATTVGWLLGRFLYPNLAVVTLGIAIGIMQWFVLQHHLKKSWHWILATFIGWTLGSGIILGLPPLDPNPLAGLLIGGAAGTAQWLILRGQYYWSGWWIAISIVGWTTGMSLLPGLFLTGIAAGVLTGIALILLIRYPKPAPGK